MIDWLGPMHTKRLAIVHDTPVFEFAPSGLDVGSL